jgi:uncharacterized protein
VQQTITSLGIGEAFVTALTARGVPTPPFATRLIPPASRMGPLTDAEMAQRLAASAQIEKYAQDIDRESAREMLAARVAPPPSAAAPGSSTQSAPAPAPSRGGAKPAPGAFERILHSPVARSVATQLTRGILGALLGSGRRRSGW